VRTKTGIKIRLVNVFTNKIYGMVAPSVAPKSANILYAVIEQHDGP
jgi:hypothetical protein